MKVKNIQTGLKKITNLKIILCSAKLTKVETSFGTSNLQPFDGTKREMFAFCY